jgi:hypothetical protein
VTASDEASPIRAIRKLVRGIEENEAAGWNQELAWCLGFRKIILESDSLVVVSLIGKIAYYLLLPYGFMFSFPSLDKLRLLPHSVIS